MVFFASFDDLVAYDRAEDALAGRVAFVNDRMISTRTGEGYGWANRKRQRGLLEAEARGAGIPALSVSAPDADQIERIHQQGETARVRVRTHAGWRGDAESGNVIAEVRGSEAPDEIVIIGAREVWRLSTNVAEHALPFFEAVHRDMAFLGIIRGDNASGGGPDMIPLQVADASVDFRP